MIIGMKAQTSQQDAPRLVGEAEFVQSLNWSRRLLAKAVADGGVFALSRTLKRSRT